MVVVGLTRFALIALISLYFTIQLKYGIFIVWHDLQFNKMYNNFKICIQTLFIGSFEILNLLEQTVQRGMSYTETC